MTDGRDSLGSRAQGAVVGCNAVATIVPSDVKRLVFAPVLASPFRIAPGPPLSGKLNDRFDIEQT